MLPILTFECLVSQSGSHTVLFNSIHCWFECFLTQIFWFNLSFHDKACSRHNSSSRQQLWSDSSSSSSQVCVQTCVIRYTFVFSCLCRACIHIDYFPSRHSTWTEHQLTILLSVWRHFIGGEETEIQRLWRWWWYKDCLRRDEPHWAVSEVECFWHPQRILLVKAMEEFM